MNLLVDELPVSVEIDGKVYPLNSDYRSSLKTILAFEDPELTNVEKQFLLLTNLFPELSEDTQQAQQKAAWFLNGGEEDRPEEKEDAQKAPRLYSFSRDAQLIYAAFRQTHGIDLSHTEYMHWWEFLALFLDLGQDTAFCNLISLRKRVKSGKATREEREIAREMGKAFEVPEIDTRDLAEREAADRFYQLLG